MSLQRNANANERPSELLAWRFYPSTAGLRVVCLLSSRASPGPAAPEVVRDPAAAWIPEILRDGAETLVSTRAPWLCPGLNDAGQLIGRCEQQSALPQPEDFAFSWSPGDGLVRLGGSFASATYVGALNNLGQAVGSSPFPAGSSTERHGFLWTRGRDMTDLGAPFGGYHSRAADSNDGGEIVGESVTHTSRFAVLWFPDGSAWDLVGLRGEPFAGASRINERGQIVGQKGQGAFLWTEDCVMQDLGTLRRLYTSAQSVNNRGRIVGSSYTTLGFSHAVRRERSRQISHPETMPALNRSRPLR